MKHRVVSGRLTYTHAGRERGRERFTITVHGDGSRIMRAMCEIFDTEVVRDVTTRLGPDWRPRDSFVRLTVNDQFTGSGWFRFGDGYAEGEAYTALEGRVSQRVDTRGYVRSFGTHPILADGWHTAMFDLAGPTQQQFDDLLISSYAFNGATGPMLLPIGFGLEYLGEERITVPAGTFDTLHFRFLLGGKQMDYHPPYEIWVTADDDRIMVRAWVGPPKDFFYELTSLAHETA